MSGEMQRRTEDAEDTDAVQASLDAIVGARWRANSSLEEWFPFSAEELNRLRDEVRDLRAIILHAASILRGEGVEDQGEAFDLASRILDKASTSWTKALG